MKLSQYKHFSKTRRRTADEDIEPGEDIEGTLGYFVSSQTACHYTVPIDGSFKEPVYYRGVIQMLMNAGEQDVAAFLINSPGGQLSGLLSLLEGLNMTEAHTVALLVGSVSSAASMFALHCDEVYVGENSTMLCHNVSYGTGGKGSDVLAHVKHISSTANKLLRRTYKNFLTEQEINDMIDGKEIYLESDEIVERLKQREILRAKEAEQADLLEQTEAKPARKSRKKPEVEPEIIV
jgi:ATP-dependent protease ClpP protease subunit